MEKRFGKDPSTTTSSVERSLREMWRHTFGRIRFVQDMWKNQPTILIQGPYSRNAEAPCHL